MDFPLIIKLPSNMYNQDILELNKINLFFGTNGSGKTFTLIEIKRQISNNFFIDENRMFTSNIETNFSQNGPSEYNFMLGFSNLTTESVLIIINKFFQQLFPNRELVKTSNSIGSQKIFISIKKLGKNFSVGADGRGIWNIIKPLETLVFHNQVILIEEFSSGLYPGILNKYYELFKEKVLEKNSCLVTTTQDPFVVYQFIKNKINDRFEWEDKDPDISLFKLSEDAKGKINIIKIDAANNTTSLKELLGDYLEGIDIFKFSHIFSNTDERTRN